MKKKLTAVALAVCMLAIMLVGASLAYFTDESDVATNVMTLGNVTIEQYEKDQDGKDFEQDQPLFPMVDNRKDKEAYPVVNGYYDPAMNNVIDKIITVENTGLSDAYVRTIIAFETDTVYNADGTVYGDAHDVYIGVLGDFEYLKDGEDFVTITIGDEDYVLAVKVYEEALPGKAADGTTSTTEPSLKQFFLAPTAGNEVATLFGDEYTILALSQAVQTEGFGSAAEALDTAFGAVTAANATDWFTK